MATVKCYVRTIVPKNAAGSYLGQYDLRIAGSVNHMGELTVENPVYSYRTDGKLYVFPASHMAQNCSYLNNDTVDIYEWEFDSNTELVAAFGREIDSVIENYSYNSTKKCTTCTMNNDFATYSLGSEDCFTAVAAWCAWLGNNVLQTIVSDTGNAYRAYLPRSLEAEYVARGEWKRMTNPYTLAN